MPLHRSGINKHNPTTTPTRMRLGRPAAIALLSTSTAVVTLADS
jgi:hypothetical protein